jgi:hypothetical protein
LYNFKQKIIGKQTELATDILILAEGDKEEATRRDYGPLNFKIK